VAVDQDLSVVGSVNTADRFDEGGLASAVVPDNREDLSKPDCGVKLCRTGA
jgi:hypothetical protein